MLFRALLSSSIALLSIMSLAAEPSSQANRAKPTTVLAPLSERFAAAKPEVDSEAPDFQRHIGPVLGRLGCNGRACHGSFQGRGGFQLSLFGYDFKADHDALLTAGSGRVDVDDVDASLILAKPTDADMHEGGKRMDVGAWQYNVLQGWIAAGAPFSGKLQALDHLEVTPAEIQFSQGGDSLPLHAVAHWADGTREDVTELCRFSTNDDAIASIDEAGMVRSTGTGDTHIVVAYDKAVVPVAVLRAIDQNRTGIPVPRASSHPIDELVKEKLEKLKIVPAELCSDSDFIRRASLDITGLLPAESRVKEFLADDRTGKREALIDELLDEPGYAAWWATRLSDWTGNSEQQLNNYYPLRGTASKLWFAWLEKRLKENVAYDKIVEGIVTAESRLPDESYLEYCTAMSETCRTNDGEAFADRPGLPQFWARNNFRAPEERAVGFAYTFLGIRIQCAQCHKHPFDKWSKEDFDQFKVLFTSVQANANTIASDAKKDRDQLMEKITGGNEIRGGDLRKKIYEAAEEGEVVPFPELMVREGMTLRPEKDAKKDKKKANARPEVASGKILGDDDVITLHKDPRDDLMRWLRDPENPYFAKAIVNRVWANYFGIGIVNPTDDMNLGNPPSNAPLLNYLATEFMRSGYDLRWLHREIVTSDTYQRSSTPNVTNAADTRNFSRHVPRRLAAEVVRDSIYLATATNDDAKLARTELTALAIGGQMGSNYKANNRDFALQVFGQSIRETNCDCDRSDQSNLLQSIYLQNDVDMHKRLSQGSGWVAKAAGLSGGQNLRDVVSDDDGDRKDRILAAVMQQAKARAEIFKKQSPARQAQLRPQFEKELRRFNEKLTKFGEQTLTVESLLQVGSADKLPVASAQTPASTGVSSDKADQWITSAYLRTLCRYPDREERQIASDFIGEASRPAEGLESLMWTLLNTKEFVLSH